MAKYQKLIIEVDGITHSHEEVAIKDEKRTADLERHGFSVLRYTDEEVLQHIEGVSFSIASWIDKTRQFHPLAPASGGKEEGNIDTGRILF